jgi:phage/plasmid primase-like uncharacterized protein
VTYILKPRPPKNVNGEYSVNMHAQTGDCAHALRDELDFIAAASAAGVIIDRLATDGKIHRCGTATHPKSKNGAYKFSPLEGGGWFKDWASGDKAQAWFVQDASSNLTAGEKLDLKRKRAAARKEADEAQRAAQAIAAEKAEKRWELAEPAVDHRYLEDKGCGAHGARIDGATLLVPVRDADGRWMSLQRISPDGSKFFEQDGAISGGMFVIGEINPDGVILIGEGFSTMATCHEATDFPAVVAFNASNVPKVAAAIRAKYPDARICIVADDDHETEAAGKGNAGMKSGREAAAAVGGALAIPRVRGGTGSDFNDMAWDANEGIDAVAETINAALGANGKKHKVAAKANPAPVKREKPKTAAPQEIEPDDDLECGETAEDEAAARTSCLRAVLADGCDDGRLEARIRRQWPQLKDKTAGIIASVRRTAARWQPGMLRKIDGMMKRITTVDQINENFVMVTVPGQASCIAQISDALFITRDDFAARLGDSVIVTGVDKAGLVKVKDASKVWFGDFNRRAANKIVFTSRETDPDHFNLWTGFGVEPQAGCCDLICNHIREVICAKRTVEYEAFIKLLAWQAQNIGRASRIIVTLFSKEQQIGKGVLLEKIMPAIFGLHGVFTQKSDQVFGRFNDLLRGKTYIGLDETCFAGDKKTADSIKSCAASESMAIEGKGLPAVQVPVAVNLYLATNHEHAAHVEKNDARYWILKVSPHRKNDRAYWARLFSEMENGGIEAFLCHLLSLDVSEFIPQRDVPIHNEEHLANQRASDPTNPLLWISYCVDNEIWVGSEKWKGRYSPNGAEKLSQCALPMEDLPGGVKMLPAFLEAAYRSWAEGQGRHVQAATTGELWKALTKVGFLANKAGGVRHREIPTIEQIRAAIKAHGGMLDSRDS